MGLETGEPGYEEGKIMPVSTGEESEGQRGQETCPKHPEGQGLSLQSRSHFKVK